MGDAEQLWEAIAESTGQMFPWMDWCHPGYSLDDSRAWIEYCSAAWDRAAEYTGEGVATGAVRRLTEFAFRETNLVRLEIVVALGNTASHRVAEKVGAIREGVAHDRLYMHGAPHDAVVYGVLRSRHARSE
ncbi:MAG: GNAT family N-acetyltransferase [Armatimonadota bacterium]